MYVHTDSRFKRRDIDVWWRDKSGLLLVNRVELNYDILYVAKQQQQQQQQLTVGVQPATLRKAAICIEGFHTVDAVGNTAATRQNVSSH